jgi:glycosyltransferase involved in cell wall biosynthesis
MTCISVALLIILSKRGKNKINYNPIQEPKIVVVLTAYNDEESIPVAVKDFKMQKNVIKVIVVDNNSSDRTYEYARISGAEVVKEENQGYGFACIRGLREALKTDANIIVLAEGDGTFVGYDINKLIPFLDNTDLVLGTRTTQELLDQQSQLDWFLVWGNLFLAKLIQIKYFDAKCWGKVRLTDVGCTMRAMRREALEKIIDQLKVGGMHFSPHMIMVALENNLKVVEVPITFRKRIGKSKGAGANRWKALKIGLRMLWHILTY